MTEDLKTWQPRERPVREPLEGRYVRLEPLVALRHGDGLYAASTGDGAADRFRYLFERAPESRAEFDAWMETAQASPDPLFFAVVDKASGKAMGRQSFMRIQQTHGVIEIGCIHWGRALARTAAATEAHYLFMRHAFDDLGYRRWEWKCDNRNGPSKRAAERFGFTAEGVFCQHMVVKGLNRDTAWYAILDSEWPALKRAYEAWLDPANFDGEGRQRRRLEEMRAGADS